MDDNDVDDHNFNESDQNNDRYYEITPCTGELKQDYFCHIEESLNDHTYNSSVTSGREEFDRACKV